MITTYQACAIQQGKARGLLIGRYLILDKLGEGGMGVVFKARHHLLDRVVALKILQPSFARQRQLVSRFRREMQAAARLNHPNIVSVLDADEYRGIYYLAMDYIEGRDLDHLVRERGPLPVEQAIDYAVQAARGLEVAHAHGIVHRDVKPGNLMLDAAGIVRVLDLGLARLVGPSSASDKTTTSNLTRSGMFMGTVDFMAPEQAEDSRNVDHRADIYSLGCSLYYLLTGRPPFAGGTLVKRIMAHKGQPPPSIRATRADVPEPLELAYLAMMSKSPDDRPQSMTDVIGLLSSSRSAAGKAVARIPLEPQTLAYHNSLFDKADDRAGGLPFEAGSNLELRTLVEQPPDPLSPALNAESSFERTPTAGPHKTAWQLPMGLAVLVVGLGILAGLTFVFSGLNRRGGEVQFANRTSRAKTPPEADPLIAAQGATPSVPDAPPPGEPRAVADTKKSPALRSATPGEGAAIEVSKKASEPDLTPKKLDLPARADITVPDVSGPSLAETPTFDVAPVFDRHTDAVRAIAVTRVTAGAPSPPAWTTPPASGRSKPERRFTPRFCTPPTSWMLRSRRRATVH